MDFLQLQQKVKDLPHVPGVYKFFDENNEIIYIGKAKSLKNRVGSYFNVKVKKDTKTHQLVQNIVNLDYIEVFSELEALILEATLIKKFKPKYNILLKDDKSYLYITITNQKVQIDTKTYSLPQIALTRERDLKNEDFNFGPYTSVESARTLFKTIRKIIPFRDCNLQKFERYKKINRPCLYGFIGLCPAPCVNNSTQSIEEYKKNVSKVKKILNGDTNLVIGDLRKQMIALSKEQNYEEALKIRDILSRFDYAKKHFKIPLSYVDNPYLVTDILNSALYELKSNIPILTNIPKKIECYDISNISGKEAVGSMVVAVDGRITKSKYRRFKIKTKNTPDDFYMLQEVLSRRIKRALQNSLNWELPDLFLIDGGKGQVSAVSKVLTDLKVNVPVVGIAKKQELLVYFDDEKFVELELSKDSEALKLVQRLRDEAHRFAKDYHHKLRLKKIDGVYLKSEKDN